MRKFLPRRFAAVAVGLALAGTLAASAWAANNAGQLDTSFGNGGLVTTGFTPGSDDLADAVTTMGDRILVAGYTSPDLVNFEFALARYNKDGSLDTSFGNGGKVVTSFGDGYDFADAVAVKGDKIVVAGEAGPQGSEDFALA
jgi:uncharacterized delta-60 repeat protein